MIDGQWQLVTRIGRGATGEIWRAVSYTASGGEPVALKLLRADLASDAEMVERFEREIETGKRIDHPNAVRIVGGGCSPRGERYLVMEEIRGRPLSTVAATEAPLDPRRVADIGRQIARGLGAAHDVGVIHRDLKPENVLVARRPGGEERVVVFDFGLSFAERGEPMSSRLTAQEFRIGTPGYMAPEYIAGGAVEPRSDLYALGVVLYELAAAQMPFDGPPPKIFRAQLTQDPPPLASRCSAPPWLCSAVDALIHRHPDDRPRDAGAVERSLAPPGG